MSGLYYAQARYYEPKLGRFGAEDPVKDQLNWYGYCGGNPVGFVDPSGLESDDKLGYWDKFARDASKFGKGFVDGLGQRSNDFWSNPNPTTFLNYISMGLTGANIARDNILTNDPSLYNFANWALSGTPDMFLGAVNPDEPLSFDHWMNSLGTATLAYGAYKGATSTLNALDPTKQIKVPRNADLSIRATLDDVISPNDATRIQNAANRTGQEINVIGSRANGTATVTSDWDYAMSGNSSQRHSAAGSVPRGTSGGGINSVGNETGIDIFTNYPRSPSYQPLDTTKPYIPFYPNE